jgi:hypothetical protein
VTRRHCGSESDRGAAPQPRKPSVGLAATVMALRTAPPVARACSFACASDGNFRTHSPIPHSGCRASAHGKACHSDSLNGVLSAAYPPVLTLTRGFSSIETSWVLSWCGATMLRARWDCACPKARQS